MIFSHAFAGAALTALTIKNSKLKLSQKQKDLTYLTGVIGSIFPDFDIVLIVLDIITKHRVFISHSLVPYIFALWLGNKILRSKKNSYAKFLLKIFFIGVMSHFALDFISGGIAAFAPFTYQLYGFKLNIDSISKREWFSAYLMSPYMNIEVIILVLYIMVSKIAKNRIYKILPMFFLLIAVIAFIVLSFI